MKKYISFVLIAVLFAACTPNNEVGTPFKAGQEVSITAHMPNAGANHLPGKQRVSGKDAGTQIDLTWDADDQITVTVGDKSATFTLTSGAGSSQATFTGTMPADGASFSVQYPIVEPDLSVQTYVENGFGKGLMKMATETNGTIDGGFTLKAQHALLGLQLKGSDALGKIVLTNLADSKTYTLDCSGVTLTDEAALFYIVVPAGEWANGFKVDVYADDNTTIIKTLTKNSSATFSATEAMIMLEQEVAIPENTDPYNGHEYVDLGLSVKWATFNVGATKPEEYGDYFAWGETEPKEVYNWSTYKWCNGSQNTLTKYNNSSSYGTVDNKTQLELSDDAARVNWGGDWRMPTDTEFTELRENCTWTWTTQNGVKGCKVTSKSNGNSIFLPAAGCRLDSSLGDAGSYGNYWSGSLGTGYPVVGLYVSFGLSNVVVRGGYFRCSGFSVRPVYGEYIPASTMPTVTTSAVTQITETTAVAGGNVTSDGGASVTERGVVYSTSENPTIASSKVVGGSGTGAFTCNLADLQAGTTYYVRAYAVNSQGTAYGEQVSFTTLTPSNGMENGYEWVDLGLSVKWATINVGATKPEEYGDYFAWGETQPKTTYNWSTYKWCNGRVNTQTKYNNNSSYGTVDNKTQLELSDDAARANWGGSWRMPTHEEQYELFEQCTWTWTTQNGVNGYKMTSKKNGTSIFLPAAGYRYDSSLDDAGSRGYYWSSSLDTDYPYLASKLHFESSSGGWGGISRYYGQSVRPVCQ